MMKTEQEIIEFNRSKIYEKLVQQPSPEEYSSPVPWMIQQQIAATNGRQYIDLLGKLKEYPIYNLPVPPVTGEKLMLDIGNGWGRWLVAGANKGYIPIGFDLRLESCKTSRKMLTDLKKPGYAVVADLENIPFKANIFDLVWSFSVIQHTHIIRLKNCLTNIQRILRNDGFTYLEFPNKNGIRNRFGPVQYTADRISNFNNWSVRYYTPKEYKEIFDEFLNGFEYHNHSFIGIGPLLADLKYVSLKNKILCGISLTGSFFANHLPGMKNISDSLYIKAFKKDPSRYPPDKEIIEEFLQLHRKNPWDNMNVVPLIRCPITSDTLFLNEDATRLVHRTEGFYYPVIDNIPVLIKSERQGI